MRQLTQHEVEHLICSEWAREALSFEEKNA